MSISDYVFVAVVVYLFVGFILGLSPCRPDQDRGTTNLDVLVLFFWLPAIIINSVGWLTKRALDGRKRGVKSKSLNGKGGSKAARQ